MKETDVDRWEMGTRPLDMVPGHVQALLSGVPSLSILYQQKLPV